MNTNTLWRNSANMHVGFFGLALSIMMSGCASVSQMALKKDSGPLDLSKKSIAVFTLRTSNQYKPAFQPNVRQVEITAGSTGKEQGFRVGRAHAKSRDFYEYLVSVDLEPGVHTLRRVWGTSMNLMIIASFSFPVDETFEVPPNAVIYIGHMDMTNRKREEGEPRSGSLVPLVDQALAGFSGGTFDVTVSDRSATDIPLFVQTYPCLRDVQIAKTLMRKCPDQSAVSKPEAPSNAPPRSE